MTDAEGFLKSPAERVDDLVCKGLKIKYCHWHGVADNFAKKIKVDLRMKKYVCILPGVTVIMDMGISVSIRRRKID